MGPADSFADQDCPDCGGLGVVWNGSSPFRVIGPCECSLAARARHLEGLLSGKDGPAMSTGSVTFDSIIDRGVDGGFTRAMVGAAWDVQRGNVKMFTAWGTPGNAKTLVLQALVNQADPRLSRLYTTAVRLMDWLRAGIGDAQDVSDRLALLRRVRFLALDEFEKAFGTRADGSDKWGVEVLGELVGDRYNRGVEGGEQVYTLLAMNAPPETLPPFLCSRIRDGRCRCVKNFDGDYRLVKEK